MSIALIVEVLDHAPAELTPPERLLLVALAEKANEGTRRCWPGMDVLVTRTGLSKRRVGNLLAALAHKGYEVRVQWGVNKHGHPVFATKGHRTVYEIPDLRRKAASTRSPNHYRE